MKRLKLQNSMASSSALPSGSVSAASTTVGRPYLARLAHAELKLVLSYCNHVDLAKLAACSSWSLARSSGEVSRRLLKAQRHYDRQYRTDRQLERSMSRINDMEAEKDRLREVFEVVDPEDHSGGGKSSDDPELLFEKGTDKAKLLPPQSYDQAIAMSLSIEAYRKFLDERKNNYLQPYEQISSALALYRTVALFHCNIATGDGYKLNWCVELRHTTGGRVCLYEWKGGLTVALETPGPSTDPAYIQFSSDVEALLTMLASPRMTIDYDGTVAGCVA